MVTPPGVLPRPSGNSALSVGGKARRTGLMVRPSTDTRTEELARLLNSKTQEQFARTLTEEAKKFGIVLQGDITDPAVLDALRQRADWAAGKIANTYQRQVDAAGGNAASVASARADWKPEQIWNHEMGLTRNAALQTFRQKNDVQMEARVLPAEVRGDDLTCVQWAGSDWLPIEQVPQDWPQHIGCFHGIETRPVAVEAAGPTGDTVKAPLLPTPDGMAPATQVSAAMLQAAQFWTAGLAIIAAAADSQEDSIGGA